MTKKFEEWRATEDYRSDYNKLIVIEKKRRAGTAVSQAFSEPTEYNIRIAFGLLTDFVSSLTSMKDEPTKKLQELRQRLQEIAKILHGDPNRKEVQDLYRKYDVGRKVERRGIYQQNKLRNSFYIVEGLYNLYTEANDLSQLLGFGSSIPFEEPNWKEKLI